MSSLPPPPHGQDAIAMPPPHAAAPSAALSNAFWRQWSASVISNLGDGIVSVAMPLLLLSLTGDARVVAFASAVAMLPSVLVGIPVGLAVDRIDRKRLMVSANAIRFALFCVIAVGAERGWLDVWILAAFVFTVGVCEVAYDSAAQALLPAIVDAEALPRANGLLASAEFVAGSLFGVAFGALLYEITVGLPFGVNAVSFAIAAALTASVAVRRKPTARVGDGVASPQPTLRGGLEWLWRHRPLRTLVQMLALTNLGLMLGQGVYAKYAADELGVGPTGYGLLVGTLTIGAATGGLIAGRVVRRFGTRSSIALPYLVFAAGNIVIGASEQAWMTAVATFSLGAAITVWNVVTISLRQQNIPAELFGRVNSVFRWVATTAAAVSMAAGGLLAHATTLRMPFLVGGTITLVTIAVYGRRALDGLEGV